MKTCSKCKKALKLTDFTKNTSRKDNLANWCKSCRSQYQKQYRKTDSGRASKRRYAGKTSDRKVYKFGISKTEYAILKEQSGGVCGICGRSESTKDWQTGKMRALAIDHCHKTKRVRGLLCGNCNRGLGMFGDDIDIMASAISYLVNTGVCSNKKDTG